MDGILIERLGQAHTAQAATTVDDALNRLTTNPDRFDDDDVPPEVREDAEQAADVAEWKRERRSHWRAVVARLLRWIW